MKKLAFVFGYGGGILALIFALMMIYTVPAGIVSNTLEDAQIELENEHIVAINEVALATMSGEVNVLNEADVKALAKDVAAQSQLTQDERVYLRAVSFVYGAAREGALSVVLIGVTIVFALISFIGALLCKRFPRLGGVFVIVAALIMLLTAIATDTLMPMVIAFGLLLICGTVAFIPPRSERMQYGAIPAAPYPPMPIDVQQQPMQEQIAQAEQPALPMDEQTRELRGDIAQAQLESQEDEVQPQDTLISGYEEFIDEPQDTLISADAAPDEEKTE